MTAIAVTIGAIHIKIRSDAHFEVLRFIGPIDYCINLTRKTRAEVADVRPFIELILGAIDKVKQAI